ncbi:S1/P1 nuclease [Legionella dresdenensis]|uniref:S1/P1 nuclease n=1 Tax=Legionella dresdenensis TaxID=450200 RepID=A0ABV8CGJ1_9GAMM
MLGFSALNTYGWSAMGHRVIAQIALDHLTQEAKKLFLQYNNSIDKLSFVEAAVWLDNVNYHNIRILKTIHYIDIPYIMDGIKPPALNPDNGITAIKSAVAILRDINSPDYMKGINTRIITHVVGDLHQPMHAVTLYSTEFKEGDMGGNLYCLQANSIAANLHGYWDKGGGLLNSHKKITSARITRVARKVEDKWPCPSVSGSQLAPETWANESYQLAITKAYKINYGQKPSHAYQNMVKQISEQRLALAGCRLASLLNQIANASESGSM